MATFMNHRFVAVFAAIGFGVAIGAAAASQGLLHRFEDIVAAQEPAEPPKQPAGAQEPGPSLAGTRPNIIVIITDDQGYGDLSCHGNPILKTPNIDKLFARSVRFTDFHASPTCAPTRAALMTGRHEFKSGVTHTIHERERLAPKATTFAQLLRFVGYVTGIFGKWHLGDEAAYQPDQRGFDEVFIHGAGGIGQTYPGSCGDAPGNKYFDPVIRHNKTFVKTKGYCTDVFFSQALDWIDAKRKEKAPFYVHIAPNAPHGPLICPAEDEKKYAGKVKPDVAKFFGMISNIDDNIGKLMAKLQEWGLEENTIIIFMTDNGGTVGVAIFNAGMRGGKVTPFQGGTRVPFFVSWPGKIKGGVDVPQLAAHVDVFPTLADLAGAKRLSEKGSDPLGLPRDLTPFRTASKIPENLELDGRSLLPLLENPQADWPDRNLFIHVGRWGKGLAKESQYANCAVRNSRFRMVSVGNGKENWQLFDIANDPGETRNVRGDHPNEFQQMKAAYDRWWNDVQPNLVNEDVAIPRYNAYHELYWSQFGGGPKGFKE
jgi:arylsulfatase A-like enzyme